MKILSVVGARPQFVKLAAVAWALRRNDHEHLVVHTGQHFDSLLSEAFFADLELPEPDVNLKVGAGSHAYQTGTALVGLEPILDEHRPDWVLVYGDTNATLAGALAAAKQNVPLAHLEAGLRSYNRRMPEEHNRVVADHLADLLLAPTELAMRNLTNEGLADRAVLIGDVMVEVLAKVRRVVESDPVRYRPPFPTNEPYLLATIHRGTNTDDPARLDAVLAGLAACPMPVWLLAHPRLVARASQHRISLSIGSVAATDPLPYPQMIASMIRSRGLITDSGGLQKEAFLLGVPCTTIRDETEWPETLTAGRNVLAPDPSGIAVAATRTRTGDTTGSGAGNPYGDGRAAARLVQELAARAG